MKGRIQRRNSSKAAKTYPCPGLFALFAGVIYPCLAPKQHALEEIWHPGAGEAPEGQQRPRGRQSAHPGRADALPTSLPCLPRYLTRSAGAGPPP